MARTEETARPATRPGVSADGGPGASQAPETQSHQRVGVLRPPGLILLGASLLVVAGLGLLYLREQTLFVATDQATVTGALVQVASPGSGQIRTVAVEVGDEVFQGQALATVALTTPTGLVLATLRSPIDGLVVARQGNPGEFTGVGRQRDGGEPGSGGRGLLILADPSSLWVEALIDQTQVPRVRPGHLAEVFIPSLGRSFPGFVTSVGPASAVTAAQLLRGNPPVSAVGLLAGATLVPVRIDVDHGELPLVLGSTASVRIQV